MTRPATETSRPERAPLLVLCAHGTRDAEGQALVSQVADDVQAVVGVEVRLAYVDVQKPTIDDAVDAVPVSTTGPSAVVVPYLLAGGFHVRVDIARAVRDRPDVVAAPALGPDDRLVDIALDRIAAEVVDPAASLVLVPAGSSDPRAQDDTLITLHRLRRRWAGEVSVGYAAGVAPTVRDAVREARERDPAAQVAVVSYLLSPGHFHTVLASAGPDRVTRPLAPDRRILEIIGDRYREALDRPP